MNIFNSIKHTFFIIALASFFPSHSSTTAQGPSVAETTLAAQTGAIIDTGCRLRNP